MGRTTRNETCPSENGRDDCRLSDASTVDTEFDPSLETRFGDRTHSCFVLNSVETIERKRVVDIPLVFSTFFFSCCVGGTHHTTRVDLRVHVYRGVFVLRNLVLESREQTRTVFLRSVMLLETDLVDVAVGNSMRLPVFGSTGVFIN